jgi:hypothetical protein
MPDSGDVARKQTLGQCRKRVKELSVSKCLLGYTGGLNRSMQHFILEGKDGVWDGTKIS